jgi:predicted GH43/DUF377 family glycosyl hydrolase
MAVRYYFSVDLTSPGLLTGDCIYSTAYAFSTDKGMSWTFRTTPVLFPAPGDAWDSGYNETANVVRRDNTLFLFYSAFNRDERNRYQIGVATLDLEGESIYRKIMQGGAVFDRNGRSAPLLPKRLGGFENNTQEPSVIFRNGNFEVFYTGLKLQNDQLGPQLEGVRGTFLGRAIFDENLVLKSRPTEPFIVNKGINIEEVVIANDRHHLFFTDGSMGEMHKGEHISYMMSNDEGRSWSTPEVILESGSGDAFDNWGIMAPTIVPDEGRFIIFYSAWGVVDSPCPPNGPRWGMPIANGKKCLHQTMGRAEQSR